MQTIGNFTIIKELGTGKTSTVYLGKCLTNNENVAIKLFHNKPQKSTNLPTVDMMEQTPQKETTIYNQDYEDEKHILEILSKKKIKKHYNIQRLRFL